MIVSDKEESYSKAKTQLRDFFEIFNDAVVEGYRDFMLVASEQGSIYDKTTRANMIQNHIFHRLKRDLANNQRVAIFVQGKLSMINIDNEFLVKVKKLDKNHRSKSITSKRVKRFTNQQPLFEDVEQMAHLELGYTVDPTGGEVNKVLIVYPENTHKNLWGINLFDELGIPTSATLFDDYPVDNEQPEYGMPPFKVIKDEPKENVETNTKAG